MADEVGALLNEVGNILAQDGAYPLDGTFLYVEAEPQSVSASIFKDLGDYLLYRLPTRTLNAVLLELWEAEPVKKRWTAMQYVIDGNRFTTSFSFDRLDPEVSTIKRRQAILEQRYGNKQVVYPSIR
jgi:hypothetical protein